MVIIHKRLATVLREPFRQKEKEGSEKECEKL